VGYSGGGRARQLEKFSDLEIIEKTQQSFKKIYGTILPDPESYVNTRWSQDPFSYGSYSYIPPGASIKDYETIAEPILNRLFLREKQRRHSIQQPRMVRICLGYVKLKGLEHA
jgi:monoamine oxidase